MKRRLKMKSIIIALFAVLIAAGTGIAAPVKTSQNPAAGNIEFDGAFALATGPGNYDSGFGVNFGAGYALTSIDRNLQARFDLSYLQFEKNYPWGKGDYTRIPMILSARYYLPPFDKLRLFGQAGVITSIDTFDNDRHDRKHEIRIGLAPGAGAEFLITPNVGVFALARAHLMSDSFVSMLFGVSMHY
jgi:opacity protein-like surface antigen